MKKKKKRRSIETKEMGLLTALIVGKHMMDTRDLHYGFWIDDLSQRTPFNFHIGVGQIYDENARVTGFIQNWFDVELPLSSFTMPAGGNVTAQITMNIENWFKGPYNYDHDVFGGSIMNNQEAMGQIKANGEDVFTAVIN